MTPREIILHYFQLAFRFLSSGAKNFKSYERKETNRRARHHPRESEREKFRRSRRSRTEPQGKIGEPNSRNDDENHHLE